MSQMTRFDEGRASELIKCGKVTRKDSEQRRWRAGGVGAMLMLMLVVGVTAVVLISSLSWPLSSQTEG